MALSHRLGHLEGRAGAVAGGKDAWEICGHPAVHLNYPVLCLQVREQVVGGHRFPEDKHPGAGEQSSVRLQPGDGLLPPDGQSGGFYIRYVLVQPLGPLGGDVDRLTAQAVNVVGLMGGVVARPTTATGRFR